MRRLMSSARRSCGSSSTISTLVIVLQRRADRLHEPARDGEAEADAVACVIVTGALEGLEDTEAVVRSDPRPAVDDPQIDAPWHLAGNDPDRRVRRGPPDWVGPQGGGDAPGQAGGRPGKRA